ncbi:MAG: hypothetical protein JSU89_02790 [Myxococcales bacterium]|nr:MAG: hypothetical protein JSU89_02790 [Myxococcales bacterium]
MIQTHRIQAVLLLSLGFAMTSLVGCSSDSSSTSPIPNGPLRILVTNDDGVGAEGIDVIVEALIENPNNEVTVCAPRVNRSGSADRTDCATGEATQEMTQSGFPATAVDGCPADAVNYALDPANGLYGAGALPHVVISGINEGQNVSETIATSISGTVGAAKTAARDHGIPALASSQGSSTGFPGAPPAAEYDYEAGVPFVLAWLAENRNALAAGTVTTDTVDSINMPTCVTGEIRDQVEVPLATDPTGALGVPQDCESELEDPKDDVQAFLNGFTALSEVPAN